MNEDQVINSLTGLSDNEIRDALQVSGLGAVTPAAVAAVKAKVNQKIKNKDRNLTRAKAALLDNLNKLPVGTRDQVLKGQAEIQDMNFYLRKNISKGGKISLVKSTDDLKVGTKNFDKTKLPVSMVVKRLELQYVNAPTSSALLDSAVSYAPITTSSPNPVLNSEFRMYVGGKLKWQGASSIFQEGIPGVSDSPKNGVNLDTLIFIKDDESVDFEFEFPDSVSISDSNDHFLEVKFRGVGIATEV